MSNTVILAGRRVLHKPGSLSFKSNMGARSVVDCIVPDRDARYNFVKGTKVAIYDSEDLIVTPTYAVQLDGTQKMVSALDPGSSPSGTIRVKFHRDRTGQVEVVHGRGASYYEFVRLKADGTMELQWRDTVGAGHGWPNQATANQPKSNVFPCGVGDHDLFIRYDSVNARYSLWMDGKLLEDAYVNRVEAPSGVDYLGVVDVWGPMQGAFYKFARWSDWLSDSELRDLFEGIPPNMADARLVSWFDFSEGTGQTASSAVGTEVLSCQVFDTGAASTPAWTPCFDYAQKKAFAGVLSDRERETVEGNANALFWNLGFTDFSAQADRRRVFEKYTSTTAGAVVTDIVTKYLAEFGVTIGLIETGSSIDEVVYNGQSCTDIFNELAKKDGFAWRIDDDQKFYFQSQKSYAAPWNITNEAGHFITMKVKDSLDGYRNRQFQRGPAQSVSDPRTEPYPGDGVRRQFKLLYRPYEKPSIAINGVPVAGTDIGIKGLVSGKKWYWTQESSIIEQDPAETVLTALDTIAVTYRGIVSMTVQIENGDDISARAAAEGTSGVYEALDEDSSAVYLNLCIQAGETHMRQNPFDKDDIRYSTYKSGLRAGMAQSITWALLDLDTVALIKSVTAKELPSQDRRMRYDVSCVTGEKADDWLEWFRQISNTRSYSLRDNEIISKCVRLEATCKCLDSVVVSTRPAARVGSATVGGFAAW